MSATPPIPPELLPRELPDRLRPRIEPLARLAKRDPQEVWDRLSISAKVGLAPRELRRAWLESLPRQQRAALKWAWKWLARPDQLPPLGRWILWLVLCGRGWGKTRTGAQFILGEARRLPGSRLALVGATARDVKKVMIEGESGILAVAPPGFRPVSYNKTDLELILPNRTVIQGFSADKPDRMRGPQFHGYWADEFCAWRFPENAWDMLSYGVRLPFPGQDLPPRGLITTTPRPIALLLQLLKDAGRRPGRTHVTRGSSYDNLWFLAVDFVAEVLGQKRGRLARQEVWGDVLDQTEGALWSYDLLDETRWTSDHGALPLMARKVVAVDPAEESGPDADEVGIVGTGRTQTGHLFVLADASLKGPPAVWGRAAYELWLHGDYDAIVVETNRGGQMVKHVILSVVREGEPKPRVIEVKATRGKATRAEPISAIWAERRGHMHGTFAALEDELCTYVPGVTVKSPNRLDAMVWGATELFPPRRVWS